MRSIAAKQRVHVVGGEQHGDALLGGDPRQQRDDLLLASDVEVGERLVEEQQLRSADEGVGDEHPLLLAAGEVADALVGEARRVDRVKHLLDEHRPATAGEQRDAEPMSVEAERRRRREPAAAGPGRRGPSGARSR